jgi:hypothetical protein
MAPVRATWRHIPEYDILHRHHCGNLKSYMEKKVSRYGLKGRIVAMGDLKETMALIRKSMLEDKAG